MINALKRLSITIVVALLVAVATSSIVFAGGPYYITENSLYWISGPQTAPIVQYNIIMGAQEEGVGTCIKAIILQFTGGRGQGTMYICGMHFALQLERLQPNMG